MGLGGLWGQCCGVSVGLSGVTFCLWEVSVGLGGSMGSVLVGVSVVCLGSLYLWEVSVWD